MRYQNRTVLVTGAGGFIASHLVEALLKEGAHVRALVRYTSHGGWGFLTPREGLEVVLGDIRDAGFVRNAMEKSDTVFHLAALIGIPYSYNAPESYFDVNVGGAMNVLNAARAFHTKVVMTSTSEVYGSALTIPIKESHPLQAQSPYAASKIASDKLAESYHLAFGLPVATVRPFNTYGPRQSSRAVIPTIISQLLGNRGPLTLGSLSPKRDMLFVEDTVEGFLLAGLKGFGKTINLGTGFSFSVGEIAETIMDIMGKKVSIVTSKERVRPSTSEVMELCADATLARTFLGWGAKCALQAGLTATIAYFTDHRNETKAAYAI